MAICGELVKQVESVGIQNNYRRAQGRESFEGRRSVVCSGVAKPRTAQQVRDQFDQLSIRIRDEDLRPASAIGLRLLTRACISDP